MFKFYGGVLKKKKKKSIKDGLQGSPNPLENKWI